MLFERKLPLLFTPLFILLFSCYGFVAESSRIKIKPFELSQVRLLSSPFKEAQDKDAKYLLSVSADSLLSKFRSNAGLEPKAPNYRGWENMQIAGHSLGHYLSALAMMYAATGDERFNDRVTYIVDQLDECQKAGKDGLISAIPNDRKFFADIKQGDVRSQGFDLNGYWVPWYTLHKEFAGLIDAYYYCGNEKALDIAKKLGDWAIDITKGLTDEQFAVMMRCEFGGMNDVLYQLCGITGEEKYRTLADRFYHSAILDPFAEGRDILPGKHGNTQFPKVIGLAQSYELTGNEKHRKITEFFWDRVVNHHTYVTGGNTMGEHFGPPDKLNDRIDGNTTETCNTYNMLKMTRHLYTWTGDKKYLDFYERGLYNHILASVDRSEDMDKLFTYFVPLRTGGFKTFSTPFDNWTCCHGSGMENHAKYGEAIYYHAEENGKDVLYINLNIPSTLDWKEKGIKVIAFDGDSTVSVVAEKPVDLIVKVRVPRNSEVKKDDESTFVSSDGYMVFDKTWEGRQSLECNFEYKGQVETMPDNPQRIAFFWGPFLQAGNIGATNKPMAAPFAFFNEYVVSFPYLIGMPEMPNLSQGVRLPTAPKPTELVPFFRATERYAVYFDVFTQNESKERSAAYIQEQVRLLTLEKMTVDFFQPGEMQPERDHNFRGEKTSFGESQRRKWRHAADGGSMTFDMKVNPEKTNKLILTYWGGDSGNRVFDIIVEGKKIAEQRLENNVPNKFFDVEYILDDESFRNKEKITVTLQARPGAFAGGLFGCRTMIVEK